jgi:outer membrane lipoprotein-sorting protein
MTQIPTLSKKTLLIAGSAALALGIPGAAIFATATPVAAQSSQLDAAVSALRGISTLKADFSQEDRRGNVAKGVMTLKRPGKIRFQYGKGDEMLVISNGKSLYLVDYAVKQVQRWPIRNSPLGALLDPSRDVKKYGKLIPTGNPNVISIEVRDPKRPEFGMMNLIMIKNAKAPSGWQLTHWVALDSQNHRTTVRLTNHRYGVAVPNSTFKFKDPRKSSRRPR